VAIPQLRKKGGGAPKFVGWATAEREGWEGVLTLDPYLLRAVEGSGVVSWLARVATGRAAQRGPGWAPPPGPPGWAHELRGL